VKKTSWSHPTGWRATWATAIWSSSTWARKRNTARSTSPTPSPAPGSVTPRVREDLIVTAEWVREELAALFRDAAVRPGDTVVGYCHLGQFATLMLFGARTLGFPIKLYDGSFQEWGSREDLPVEGPGGD